MLAVIGQFTGTNIYFRFHPKPTRLCLAMPESGCVPSNEVPGLSTGHGIIVVVIRRRAGPSVLRSCLRASGIAAVDNLLLYATAGAASNDFFQAMMVEVLTLEMLTSTMLVSSWRRMGCQRKLEHRGGRALLQNRCQKEHGSFTSDFDSVTGGPQPTMALNAQRGLRVYMD